MNEERFAVILPHFNANEFLVFDCEETADKYLAENINNGAYKIRYSIMNEENQDG